MRQCLAVSWGFFPAIAATRATTMQRTYEYKGFTLEVFVEADFKVPKSAHAPASVGHVALVRIFRDGVQISTFSPLRFGDLAGRAFGSDVEALMGGYSAARKVIDDLFTRDD
ncbi:hypothetical protein [Paraburkholderia caballeronis]|nr:hypothetical protein [Paraburkholderia caballeronis]PXW26359.1 hypothetical protein C7403_104232 [Paraburkholderia caballeronis]PXX01906.1 hypothetical protein C7407_104232 [Paraburkholderia caballeronis]SEC00157.1 hypothetical protein SAMN05445871_1463 [Paraburkholderia caballeronis]